MTTLGITGSRFTLNGKSTFLLGISYYGALGATAELQRRDLDDIQRLGFNWIRVWATWAAFDNDVSAVDPDGDPREPFMTGLRDLVAECDRRGLVVDVTVSRGNGLTGPARLPSLEAMSRAVTSLVTGLRAQRNWYLDLANERNIRDRRHVSFDELRQLRDHAKAIDPQRLLTASHAGDIDAKGLQQYVEVVRLDFLCPHRPRNGGSPTQTAARTRRYLAELAKLGRVVPVHYQEPFRRGFRPQRWEPPADAFVTDLREAIAGGAAGWCFHNGDQKDRPESRPRRSFDMRTHPLFGQLDDEEKEALARIAREFPSMHEQRAPAHAE